MFKSSGLKSAVMALPLTLPLTLAVAAHAAPDTVSTGSTSSVTDSSTEHSQRIARFSDADQRALARYCRVKKPSYDSLAHADMLPDDWAEELPLGKPLAAAIRQAAEPVAQEDVKGLHLKSPDARILRVDRQFLLIDNRDQTVVDLYTY